MRAGEQAWSSCLGFQRSRLRTRHSASSLRNTSLTSLGLARPCVAFITWPTNQPITACLPARYAATFSGLEAITARTVCSIAALSLTSKFFKIQEQKTIEFRAEFFNLLNHVNFANPELNAPRGPYVDLSNPDAGKITTTLGYPRLIQFALKFRF